MQYPFGQRKDPRGHQKKISSFPIRPKNINFTYVLNPKESQILD